MLKAMPGDRSMLGEKSEAASGTKGLRNVRLLVVDDDVDYARLVKEHLTDMGYLVETAHNGREGLGLFRNGDFPVVLTDLDMPGMNGIELLQNIKRIDQRAAVVIITGSGTLDLAISAVKNGAHDFVVKPVTPERLKLLVERAIEYRDCLR
jgi:DNA-binding NtrC family response regulator